MTFRTLLMLAVAGLVAAYGPATAAPTFCPPGLAKKEVPCVPPGQVGKTWVAGQQVDGDYVLIPREVWQAWGLPEPDTDEAYLQIDGSVLKVLRDTLIVIEAIEILGDLLN